jgi:Domain of unknown function (DUF5916)/Carbohydrate family 9 binding domain-like
MKKLSAIIFLFIFTVYIQAQTPNTNSLVPSDEPTKNDSNKSSNAESGGKFNLPPEKMLPVGVVKFTAPPIVDGKLDDEVWKSAQVLKDFYQTNPGNNIAASKPTEVMLGYDEKNLYIAFRCFDEKDKIRATVAKRDEVFGEDNVRVWLDTYNDQRRAYVIGFNPYGIQQDGIFTEGSGSDFSVDIVMESKGVIEDWGWSVEVQIPFKSLRYTAGKGKLWGFNAARNIDRLNDEFDQWLPDDRDISGFLVKHGKLSGLNEIKYERTLEIVPSITLSETGSRKRTLPISTANSSGFDPISNPIGLQDFGRFVNDSIKPELGVNLKYTLSPNVTLDAAINPDFAEIEADAAVVTANQRFPIFFEEKRPFFLEGKEIFDSPLSPFYSRTIIDPDVAAKVTGKVGANSFGLLVASDNAPGNYSLDERTDPFISRRISEFVDKNAYFAVARAKHDIGNQNNVGFFATARVFPKNRNFVGGFDGTFKLNPKTVMNFQVLGSHSRKNFYDSDEDRGFYRTGNGIAYFWNIDYTTDTRGWFIEAVGRSSNYRSDAGFAPRTNTNTFFFFNRFSTKSDPKAAIIRANWRQFARYRVDWQGRTQGALIGTGFNLNLQGNLYIGGEGGLGLEKIYEDEFGARRNVRQSGAFFGAPTRTARQPYLSINLNKTINKQLSVYGFVGSIFNAFDFDFGAGSRYPRASPAFQNYLNSPEYAEYIRLLLINPNNPNNFFNPPALDPGKGWQFDAQVGGEYKPINPLRISLDYTKARLKRSDNNRVAFDTNIVTLRSTYQFSRFTFLRTRVDYDSLRSNFSGQILAGYNPNPGTAFYVGYNDNFNYNGFSPFTGQLEPRFERNSRTFFIRASYLFRKSF